MEDVPGAPAPALPWLALALAAPLGPGVCRRLRERFPDPARLGRLLAAATGPDAREAAAARAALAAPRGPLTPAHAAALVATSTRRRVDATLRWLADDPLASVVTLDDPRYPADLAAIADPPPLLHVRGAREALVGPAVAVVGSRDATHGGRERARALAGELAASGIVVVSGLALGIDAAAHAGAVEGGGRTLAFVATGADGVYPRRHRALAEAVLAAGGAMASEFPLGHVPKPWCFPQRNRLIGGASLGVVVVEARLPSGSLTTVRHALEQGREVMAVPGAVDNPATAGCHALIRDGAALVTSGADVLHALAAPLARALATASERRGGLDGVGATPTGDPPLPPGDDASRAPSAASGEGTCPSPPAPSDTFADGAERRVHASLVCGPATLARLAARTGLDAPTLLAALARLELDGRIVVDGGGRYERR